VIAMVFFAYFCDLSGYLNRNHQLLEVSWWNMLVASIAIFLAVIFGQLEAALAQAYPTAQAVLDYHTINGWTISVILVMITAWRSVLRLQNPLKLPVTYLGATTFLLILVCLQMYLGDLVYWVYGIHTAPVVEAIKKGLLR